LKAGMVTGARKSNQASFHDAADAIRVLTRAGNINGALSRIADIVSRVSAEPLCTARVFSSSVLDDLCVEIGAAALCLPKLASGIETGDLRHIANSATFLASRLQASGGHTRVIEDFVRLLPHEQKHLLVTEMVGRSDRCDAATRFSRLGAVVEYAPRGNALFRLLWLQRRLREIGGRDVYLFNHHDDSVAVAGVAATGQAKVHFYHHGDHHLCLGVHLAGMRHIDIHSFGYHNCRDSLHVADNVYLPLTAEDLGARPDNQPFRVGGALTTCTAAGWNKLEAPHSIQYVNVVPMMLAMTGGQHIHIGRLTPLARWRIHLGLRKFGIDSSAFVYIPHVASVWGALQQFNVDLYVSSFPVHGARTMVEVMGAGVPIAVHDHPTSRFLGGMDMAYPEAFLWREPEELLAICRNATAEQLRDHSIAARNHYWKYHRPELLREALVDGRECAPPPLRKHVTSEDPMQFALDVARQCDVWATVRKVLRRAYRRARAWWSQYA
jgi:hypothetical protein